MSKANNLTDFLTDLANTLRSITGGSALIDPQDFSSVIQNLPQPLFKSLVGGSITEVTAGDLAGVTTVTNYAFYSRQYLLSVALSDSVQGISTRAFSGCWRVSSFSFGNGLQNIGQYAVAECTGIRIVILPGTLTRLNSGAFADCSNLTKMVIKAINPPELANISAFHNTNNCPIYVPTPDDYKVETNWVTYDSRIFPLVSMVSDLSNIDTTTYTKACVEGNEEYIEYTYDGSQWNAVNL